MSRLRLIIVLLCSVLIHVILFVYLTNRITFKPVDNDFDPIEVEMFQKIQPQAVNQEQNNQAKSAVKITPMAIAIFLAWFEKIIIGKIHSRQMNTRSFNASNEEWWDTER